MLGPAFLRCSARTCATSFSYRLIARPSPRSSNYSSLYTPCFQIISPLTPSRFRGASSTWPWSCARSSSVSVLCHSSYRNTCISKSRPVARLNSLAIKVYLSCLLLVVRCIFEKAFVATCWVIGFATSAPTKCFWCTGRLLASAPACREISRKKGSAKSCPSHVWTIASWTFVTVYERSISRVPLDGGLLPHLMSTFHTRIHQRYVM
jgi:hypothetical protein